DTVARRRPGTRAAAAPSRSPSDQVGSVDLRDRAGLVAVAAGALGVAARLPESGEEPAQGGRERPQALALVLLLEQPLLVDRRHLDLGGDRVSRPGGLGAGRVGSDRLEQLRERL